MPAAGLNRDLPAAPSKRCPLGRVFDGVDLSADGYAMTAEDVGWLVVEWLPAVPQPSRNLVRMLHEKLRTSGFEVTVSATSAHLHGRCNCAGGDLVLLGVSPQAMKRAAGA